ncbi:MAG: hypothetical protein HOP28_06845 [Gemmatimonadales bacterium]|nr:hypothetical protein [Gemmatimonadales bacterium]
MSADTVQNYGSHVRWLPAYHFFVIPVLALNFLLAAVTLARTPSVTTFWTALVALVLGLGAFLARVMALTVQNRVIRLEETLRLERLLPGRYHEFERITAPQLVGLRFASDEEVPHLVDRILSAELVSKDDIKRAVQHWRPDHLRA